MTSLSPTVHSQLSSLRILLLNLGPFRFQYKLVPTPQPPPYIKYPLPDFSLRLISNSVLPSFTPDYSNASLTCMLRGLMKPKMSRALVAQCKESACNARGLGSIPGLGRSPREGKGYPLQYSGLENSMDCIVRGVTKSRTRLSDFHLCWSYLSFLQFASFTISKSPSVVCAFYP